MKIRSSRISDSILAAVSGRDQDAAADRKGPLYRRVLQAILAFLSLFRLLLTRYRSADFRDLRASVWQLDEQEYIDSFRQAAEPPAGTDAADPSSSSRRKGKDRERAQLTPVGDLGYSGSTFFTTPDAKYLIKSLPRRFEHQFFTHDLLEPYLAHMRRLPHSLLVRITDMVYTPLPTLGGILGLAPTHHIIMENLLYGKDADGDSGHGWETYDLKPNDYFFPERDLAGGRLAPESVKERLVDEFPDKIKVTEAQRKELLDTLETDTQLLAEQNAIDYSLFLVRYPGPGHDDSGAEDVGSEVRAQSSVKDIPRDVPVVCSNANRWRTGVVDVEGRWTYRVVVLDFFWARHKLRARTMTVVVKLFNKIAHKGPMSITANPAEYRERFLRMVREIVV